MRECLESSSNSSKDDSCSKQGYEYNDPPLPSSESVQSSYSSQSSNNNTSESNNNNNDSTIPRAYPNTRARGGRPLGSTNDNQLQKEIKEARAKYKIVCRYLQEKDHASANGMKKRECYDRIVTEERDAHGLEQSFCFSYFSAMSRIRRKSLDGCGTFSPLAVIENDLVDIIVCMSKIKRSLTVSEGLYLCNQLIADTEIQNKLIDFKISRNIFAEKMEDLGKVGRHYWKKFLARNRSKIRSKTPKKFSLDRSSWTTFMNFEDMYEHVEKVMVESNIAKKLPSAQWMDMYGKVVQEEHEACGCKVEVELQRPDLALVLDEVGCNLSQELDNAIGGELYLTGRDDEAYRSVSTRYNHFTVLGVTSLSGEPVLCVVIIAGKKGELPIATGLDWSVLDEEFDDNIEDGKQFEYFQNNRGEGNLFPEGPVCNYKGKDIPCFVAFSEGGGMDGHILTNIFRHLDELEVFKEDREQGYTPFVLLDGHQSRFELEFLKYINDPDHRWNTCIGVPYGTSLWQVGDSQQQNGKFKMLLTKRKREMFEERMKSFNQHLHLLRTDIMLLVRDTWHLAFGDVEANLHAISERGWNPLNKNLLLNPIIMASMTESMIKRIQEKEIFPSKVISELCERVYTDTDGSVSLDINKNNRLAKVFNFKGGPIASHVANCIMSENDREEARERNKQLKKEGKTLADRISTITKRMTAGKLVVEAGCFHLNEFVMEQAEKRQLDMFHEKEESRKRDELKYFIDCYKADEALKANKHNPNPKDWRKASDIRDFLRPLRQKDDTAMPLNREGLETRYYQWSLRGRNQIVHNKDIYEMFESWLADQNSKKKASTKGKGKRNKKSATKDKKN